MEIPTSAIRQETKGTQAEKEKTKLALFADDIMIYRENTKESNNKTLFRTTDFSKVFQLSFYIQAINTRRLKIKIQCHL